MDAKPHALLGEFRRIVILCTFAFVGVAGCGGHDADSDSGPPVATPTITTTVIQAKVNIAADVPLVARNTIASVVSSMGTANLGAELPIPVSDSGGDSIVFAVGPNDTLMLAAIVQGPDVILSSASTAVALTRIAYGALPDTISVADINTAIARSANFSALVASVDAALLANRSPASDDKVLTRLGVVLDDVDASIPAISANGQETLLAFVQTIPSVVTDFPYTLRGFGRNRTEMTNANYLVTNRALIAWNLHSSQNDKDILLGGTKLDDAIFGNPTSETLTNNGGNGFNITISQTLASKRANTLSIATGTLKLVVDMAVGTDKVGKCVAAQAKAFMQLTDLDPVLNDPSADNLSKYLLSVITVSNLRSIAKDCVKLSSENFTELFVNLLIKATIPFFDARKAVATVGTFGHLVQYRTALATIPSTVGVCESTVGGTHIVNCAASFAFDPEPTIKVDDSVTPLVKAFDIHRAPTARPANLEFTSQSPQATVDKSTGRVTGVSAGSALIEIRDSSTGNASLAQVTVVAGEPQATMVSIKAEPNEVALGALVVFTATVRSTPSLPQRHPTGSVTFMFSSGLVICSGTLNEMGVANCAGVLPSRGTAQVFASYAGDTGFQPSRSLPATVTVTDNPAPWITVDLGALNGSTNYSAANAINASGLVVGNSTLPPDPSRGGDPRVYGVVFDGTSPTPIQPLATVFNTSGFYSTANAINAAGQVTGLVATSDGLRAYITRNGVVQNIGTLGGTFSSSEGAGINSLGKVTGVSSQYTENYGSLIDMRAFFYDGSTMRSIGTLGGNRSGGTAVNDNDQVVGWSTLDADISLTHGFLYSPRSAGLRDIGTLGGRRSFARAINQVGQIVGWADTTTPGVAHAFAYTVDAAGVGAMVDLGTLGGNYSDAYAINNNGQITGVSRTTSGDLHPFLYTDGKMIDISSKITGFNKVAERVLINDAGQIAATGHISGSGVISQDHAIRVTPSP